MIALWLALLGCSDPPTDRVLDTSEPIALDTGDSDVDPEDDCTLQIASIWPMADAVDVAPDLTVKVQLNHALDTDDNVDLEVVGESGVTTLSEDRTTLTWSPDSPLARDTTFVARTHLCGASIDSAFTTLPEAVPLAEWDHRAWSIDTATVEVVTPALIAPLITTIDAIVVQTIPGRYGPSAVLQSGTAGADGYRTDCALTVDAGPIDTGHNPRIQVGPVSLDVGLVDQSLELSNLVVSAIVAPRGEHLRSLRLSATVDTRSLIELEELCPLSAGLGEPCVPCSDGIEACMPVVLRADTAEQTDLLNTCE